MGCSDSKETSEINHLKNQCERICKENLSCMQIIEYMLIEKNNLSEAILLFSLKKRTESYYSIISQYRNFWISEAKKSFKDTGESKHITSCIKEQEREKTRLNFTKQTLLEQVEKLNPNWQDHHESLNELKEQLESNPLIVQRSSTLYGSFYIEDKRNLKIAALKHCRNIETLQSSIYKAVKNVTVALYKIPENRVYYTSKIVHEKLTDDIGSSQITKRKTKYLKSQKSIEMSKIEIPALNRSIDLIKNNKSIDQARLSIDLQRISIDQNRSNGEIMKSSTDHPRVSFDGFRNSNAETLQKYSSKRGEKTEMSESFSSEIEDEETLARLSYTQK